MEDVCFPSQWTSSWMVPVKIILLVLFSCSQMGVRLIPLNNVSWERHVPTGFPSLPLSFFWNGKYFNILCVNHTASVFCISCRHNKCQKEQMAQVRFPLLCRRQKGWVGGGEVKDGEEKLGRVSPLSSFPLEIWKQLEVFCLFFKKEKKKKVEKISAT